MNTVWDLRVWSMVHNSTEDLENLGEQIPIRNTKGKMRTTSTGVSGI